MADPDYRAIFESVPGLYLVLDPDLRILAATESYLAATLTRRDEVVGRPLFEVFPDNPDDPNADGTRNLAASLQRVLRDRVADRMPIQKYDIRRPDGTFEERWWSPRNVPSLGPDGQVAFIVHNVTDVTDTVRQKERGDAREEQAALLEGLFEHLPSMIFVKDETNLAFVRLNRAAERIIGLPRESLLGKTDYDFFPKEQADFFRAKDRETLADPGVLEVVEEPLDTPSGRRWLFTRKIGIKPISGRPGFLVGISTDITEKKAAEAALQRAQSDLAAANAELEAFSYSVAHDLRAPLRSIDGFSQAILEDYADRLDDAGREYLGYVRDSASRMGRLIDDLLMLSRVTRSDLRRAPVDLSALAEATIERLRRQDPDRRVDTLVAPELRCEGDERLLGIVLDNLIGNAWKFTSRRTDARIQVGVEVTDGEDAWFVRDNGAGFDSRYADKLFGVFQRLHAATQFEGTGIGLATVQRIVRRHGGRVWARSEPEKGATFWFTLGAAA